MLSSSVEFQQQKRHYICAKESIFWPIGSVCMLLISIMLIKDAVPIIAARQKIEGTEGGM